MPRTRRRACSSNVWKAKLPAKPSVLIPPVAPRAGRGWPNWKKTSPSSLQQLAAADRELAELGLVFLQSDRPRLNMGARLDVAALMASREASFSNRCWSRRASSSGACTFFSVRGGASWPYPRVYFGTNLLPTVVCSFCWFNGLSPRKL